MREMCMCEICMRMCKNLHTHAYGILMPFITQKTEAKTPRIAFLSGWPWPLTYDLDLRTCPRYHQGQSMYQISWPYAKRFSRESAINWQTDRHTHTDGSVFITSTADAGGNKTLLILSCNYMIVTLSCWLLVIAGLHISKWLIADGDKSGIYNTK